MKRSLDFTELEQVYERIAQAIDEAGEGNETLFLGKLCIALAQANPDFDAVVKAIDAARGNALPVENE